jgi:hypothetical protein
LQNLAKIPHITEYTIIPLRPHGANWSIEPGTCTLRQATLLYPESIIERYKITSYLYFPLLGGGRFHVETKGVGRGPTLAWPGWKQPDIPVEVDTDQLETSRSEAEVLKKLSLAGIAKLSWLKYR